MSSQNISSLIYSFENTSIKDSDTELDNLISSLNTTLIKDRTPDEEFDYLCSMGKRVNKFLDLNCEFDNGTIQELTELFKIYKKIINICLAEKQTNKDACRMYYILRHIHSWNHRPNTITAYHILSQMYGLVMNIDDIDDYNILFIKRIEYK
jgi:hypothetical protein